MNILKRERPRPEDPGQLAADNSKRFSPKNNLPTESKKSQAKKRARTGGNCSFYFENDDPCIVVEANDLEHVAIAINSTNFMLDFTIPRKSLRKLLIAGQKFMESGKRSSFCGGDFRFGEVGESEIIPAEEMLEGGL